MGKRTWWASVFLAAVFATPTSAATTPLTGAVQIAVGSETACAITATGGLKCWGKIVGDGTTTAQPVAVDVPGLSSGVVAVTGNSSGEVGSPSGHVCALLSGGTVKCWGANYAGQLGDGSTTIRYVPVDVVGLGGTATGIAAGQGHTCALMSDTTVKCWGFNGSPPTSVPGLSGVTAITAGYDHRCALVAGGGVKCWGSNGAGALGDGTTTSSTSPVDVVSLASGVASVVAAGGINAYNYAGGHTCALTTSGGMKCWGSNLSGELGNGTQTSSSVPFDVLGLTSGVVGISAGGSRFCSLGCPVSFQEVAHSCALMAAGGVKCWGSRFFYNTGNPSPGDVRIPSDVTGLPGPVQAISSGGGRTCALGTDGRVSCWDTWPNTSMQFVQVGAAPQTITLGQWDVIPLNQAILLPLSASSGLQVVVTTLTPSICTVSGMYVTAQAQGKCTLAANQPGNANWEPAPELVFSARAGDKLAQTITFGAAPSVFVGGVGTVSATASSGLAVSFASTTPSTCTVSGNVVTGVATGSCTVVASQAGDLYYAAAPQVTQTFPVSPNDGSAYSVNVLKQGEGTGNVSSAPAGIDCGGSCGANFASGSTVSLTATPTSNSYFVGWSGACTGTGTCSVSITAPQSVTAMFKLTASIPRLVNIATRAHVFTGNNVMIGGFIIGGSTPKTVVVRARGPSLGAQGVPNVLADPTVALYSGQTQLASNNDWGSAANAAAISASGFQPLDSKEAAILTSLAPGPYTAIVAGNGGTTGNALVEVFEVDNPQSSFVNMATRALVLTGNDVMIAGFIIQGEGPQTVVVRARGPSLTSTGISNPLANPSLSVYYGSSLVAGNDDWNDQRINAAGLAPAHPLESAVMLTLSPGPYTAIVTGVSGGTGVAIVEVFRVP